MEQVLHVPPYLLRVLRIARVLRALRLVKMFPGLRTLLSTIALSLPALVNLGSLLVLFVFVYAVLGMQCFGQLDASFAQPASSVTSPTLSFARFGAPAGSSPF